MYILFHNVRLCKCTLWCITFIFIKLTTIFNDIGRCNTFILLQTWCFMGELINEHYTQHHLHMHNVFLLSFLSLHGIQVRQRIKEKKERKWLSHMKKEERNGIQEHNHRPLKLEPTSWPCTFKGLGFMKLLNTHDYLYHLSHLLV